MATIAEEDYMKYYFKMSNEEVWNNFFVNPVTGSVKEVTETGQENLVSRAGFLLQDAMRFGISSELAFGISKWMNDFYELKRNAK